MVDFVMAEVEAPKSFERAIQESIAKVLETFDVVENLSAEQSDTICNFILRKDLLAMHYQQSETFYSRGPRGQ